MAINRSDILDKFKLFQGGTGGLDSWLGETTPASVFEALSDLENQPLTRSRLNQLLTLAHEAPVSQPMFAYYWLTAPNHPYDVRRIPYYDERWINAQNIQSIDQFYWGLYRFYVDALLYFGSIRTAYQRLRQLPERDLYSFFAGPRIDCLSKRGNVLPLSQIAREHLNKPLSPEIWDL